VRFEDLVGKTVSIAIVGKDNKIEAYTGIVKRFDDPWIYLEFFSNMILLEAIYIHKDLVRSIWIYREAPTSTAVDIDKE